MNLGTLLPLIWLTEQKVLWTIVISHLISFVLCKHTTQEVIVNTEEVVPTNWTYTGRSRKEIEKIFKKHGIIPDLIDAAPEYELTLRYVGGISPDFGTKHTLDELRYAPYALEFPTTPHVTYSLFMFDLDSPSRTDPTKRAYYHWGLANIPKNSILKAETLAEYIAPFPDNGTGEHRYVFLVYKQPFGSILYLEPRLLHLPDDTHRANWNVRKIVKRYKLEGPIAGNFLYSEWHPPAENPYMGHTIITHEPDAPKGRKQYGSRSKTTTTLLPPDKLEEADVIGPEPQ